MTPQPNPSPSTGPSRWRIFIANFQRRFGRIPIVGPLTNCTVKNHLDSLKEFSITILFGTATFWVTAIFLKAFLANSAKTNGQILHSTVGTGQLFIFAVGMLGPILLASAEDPDTSKQFPGRTYHFALILLLGVLASGLYAFVLASREPQAAGLFDSNFLYRASVCIALVVVVMRYLTTVYRKSTATFNAEEGLKEPVNDFAAAFNARHPAEDTMEALPLRNDAADDMAARLNSRNGG
jgi:hypothetical protein